MRAEVSASDGVVLLDIETPKACCLTLTQREALDLAKNLIGAVAEATEPPRFDPRKLRPW